MTKVKRAVVLAPEYYGIDKSIAKAFEQNGCETLLINYRTKVNWIEKLLRKTALYFSPASTIKNWVNLFFLMIENHTLFKKISLYKPEILFIIKGESLLPSTLTKIKKRWNTALISYQWDDPFNSHADKNYDTNRKNNFNRSKHLFDYIFVFDNFYVQELKKQGLAKVSYLPLATDPEIYKQIDLSVEEKQEYSHDICFVGAPFPNRVELFNSLQEYKLGVYGDGWQKIVEEINPSYYKGKASGEKVLKLYSASKIILNIHHPQSIYGLNTRTFDIPATGAFELVDYKSGLESLFNLEYELVAYKDFGDLIKKIKYFLGHPDEMKQIAQRGYQKVLQTHTWKQRISEVLTTLQQDHILK